MIFTFLLLSPKTDRNVRFQRGDLRLRMGSTSILAEVAHPGNRKTHCNWLFHSQSAALQTAPFFVAGAIFGEPLVPFFVASAVSEKAFMWLPW